MTRILLVGAEETTAGTERALRSNDPDWEIARIEDGEAASRACRESGCDVLVAEPPIAAQNVAALLSAFADEHPDTARILLGGGVEPREIAGAIPLAHQYLGRAQEGADVVALVERTLSLKARLGDPALAEFFARHRVPEPPPLYGRLLESIRSQRVSNADLTKVIIRDAWLVSELLRVVNKTFFDRSSPVMDPRELVGILGTTTLQALVLHVEIFRAIEGDVGSSVDVAEAQRHARVAADLAVRIADGANWWNQARTTALLHDLGGLILAALTPNEYRSVRDRAQLEGRRVSDVELDILGVTHADVGAYVCGRWGLPWTIVEPIATHHDQPPEWFDEPFDTRHAVFVTEALLEEGPVGTGRDRSELEAILAGRGSGRLDGWRDAVRWVHSEAFEPDGLTGSPPAEPSRRAV